LVFQGEVIVECNLVAGECKGHDTQCTKHVGTYPFKWNGFWGYICRCANENCN
jgi:hypothetical protein